jgi:hypothetical protein
VTFLQLGTRELHLEELVSVPSWEDEVLAGLVAESSLK